jgi:hypothetical protein
MDRLSGVLQDAVLEHYPYSVIHLTGNLHLYVSHPQVRLLPLQPLQNLWQLGLLAPWDLPLQDAEWQLIKGLQ